MPQPSPVAARPAPPRAAHRRRARRTRCWRRRSRGSAATWCGRAVPARPGAGAGRRDRPGRRSSTPPSPRCRRASTTPAPGAQRDRRRAPHQPRPGAAVRPPPSRRCAPRPAPSTSSSTSPPGGASTRGRGTLAALLELLPEAEAALVVNNGAAALVLATTALAAGREVVVSRGEMVEIGDGFRLPDLIASRAAPGCARSAPRTAPRCADYAAAIGPDTGCVLKVHPSNFRGRGVHLGGARSPTLAGARRRRWSHDIGSGLLPTAPAAARRARRRHARCADGAAVVTCSGDKLLGGPQAGLVLGRPTPSTRLRRHPLARAVRADKTTLAALEATLRGPRAPGLGRARGRPRPRCARGATRSSPACPTDSATAVPADGVVGGGGAPGLRAARAGRSPSPRRMPRRCARHARRSLARVERGRCLVDLRCIPADADRVWWRRRSATPRGSRLTALMAVVATAGHVDHGKSTLVRALTGQEPDRWAEERRRGMTIDLGYAWTDIDGRRVSLVDVPGHEHFTGNMLAGLGPVGGGAVRRRGRRGLVGRSPRSTPAPSPRWASSTCCSS